MWWNKKHTIHAMIWRINIMPDIMQRIMCQQENQSNRKTYHWKRWGKSKSLEYKFGDKSLEIHSTFSVWNVCLSVYLAYKNIKSVISSYIIPKLSAYPGEVLQTFIYMYEIKMYKLMNVWLSYLLKVPRPRPRNCVQSNRAW